MAARISAAAPARSEAKKTGSRTRKPPILPNPLPFLAMVEDLEAHSRLCQCLIAFGIGAGPIRVTGSAALWFYARLWPYFRALSHHPTRRYGWLDADDYKSGFGKSTDYGNEAAQVLDLSRSAGRYAAQYATAAGCFAIKIIHVKRAMEKFGKVKPDRGPYCFPDPPLKKRRSKSASKKSKKKK